MQEPNRVEKLVQYMSLAVNTISTIADSTEVPLLGPTASLSSAIMKSIETATAKRGELIQIGEQIHEILCVVVSLYSASEVDEVLSPTLMCNMAKFIEALQKLYSFLESQGRMGKIKKLLRAADSSSRLKEYRFEFDHLVNIFRISHGVSTVAETLQLKRDIDANHKQLLALIEDNPQLVVSESSSVAGTLASSNSRFVLTSFLDNPQIELQGSSASLSMLPPMPQIFHGRQSELQHLLELLAQDSARIAILGPGGMGKTCLAISVLHHSDVIAKYAQRYFIPCQSTFALDDLLSQIASRIGVDKGTNISTRIVQQLQDQSPALIVLDNFETPWEPHASRFEVELFLEMLADISHLAILITIRGTERPQRVKWSRPFMNPISPLSHAAAFETFADVADDRHEDSDVEELLALTDNIPLAVSLIASVAAAEGCARTLERWKRERTHILSDGHDQKSSLDISISLSLFSPRMTDHAQELLSILCLLPDGLAHRDLIHSRLPIPNILACRSTLLQTSLAYIGNDKNLKVLVPIREYVGNIMPPPFNLRSSLLQYFKTIFDVPTPLQDKSTFTSQITKNLGNVNALLYDALHFRYADIKSVVATAVHLSSVYRMAEDGLCPLMLNLAEYVDDFRHHPIFADYLLEHLLCSVDFPILDIQAEIEDGSLYFKHRSHLDQAKWYNSLSRYYMGQANDRVKALECLHKVVELCKTTGPCMAGQSSLRSLAHFEWMMGHYTSALEYADSALECGQVLGDLHGQAQSICLQAMCHNSRGNFAHAAKLCAQSRHLLSLCGLERGQTYIKVQNLQAEIYYLKTEYAAARHLHVSSLLAARDRAPTANIALCHLNLALIDIQLGSKAEQVQENLTRSITLFEKFGWSFGLLYCDTAVADLLLSQGKVHEARAMFQSCFAAVRQYSAPEAAAFCLERLADVQNEMNHVHDVWHWAGTFLAFSVVTKNSLTLMKAIRCYGNLFAVSGEDSMAFTLFQVALEGFTFMDVHRWKAKCMIDIGDILERRGELHKSMALALRAAASNEGLGSSDSGPQI
ncbi:hypothetical protein C8J57DRAFT_1612495 [Mycena rebaudengoi]|nr:hypothetical protein C8J57DRAFT_1612495 [Mycena rebaudengoi]